MYICSRKEDWYSIIVLCFPLILMPVHEQNILIKLFLDLILKDIRWYNSQCWHVRQNLFLLFLVENVANTTVRVCNLK